MKALDGKKNLVQSVSAGPSAGYLVVSSDGPVVMPVVWSVVTARLLSSLFLMATKASPLCGALPSTQCCGCWSRCFSFLH